MIFTITMIIKIVPIKFIGVGIWELGGAFSAGIVFYIENRELMEAPVK